jgi:catechol 2,3-dioxygenase-like lactoylglutathione lyase family enzyme
MGAFTVHHTAISVRQTQRSIAFYEYFGFRVVFVWHATDESLEIVHLRNDAGQFLELVCYASPKVGPAPGVGNDLDQLGVKHLALTTRDLHSVWSDIVDRKLGEVTEVTSGRTQMELFFVRDPDGFWLEILSDTRQLDPANPTQVQEAPRLLAGE